MACCRLEVADRRGDDEFGAVAHDQVDTAEHVPERLGEAGAVGEEVGGVVVAGGIAAQGIVGQDQEDVEHPEEATECGDEGEPPGEGRGRP